MSKQYKTVSLSDEQRIALEALCRRRKVDALVCKRARAFLLLDAGEDARTVCRILDIGPTVLTEWRFAFAGAGLSFFSLKDYSQRQGHLSVVQEQAVMPAIIMPRYYSHGWTAQNVG
jgi:DNA-directed RNA polymerase subunit F